MVAMFKGQVAFWKCFVFTFILTLLFECLLLILGSAKHLSENFTFYLVGLYVLFFTWCGTSLYRCADNTNFIIVRFLGKACGLLAYYQVISKLVYHTNIFVMIFGASYAAWLLSDVIFSRE